jgi:hypothetical protein
MIVTDILCSYEMCSFTSREEYKLQMSESKAFVDIFRPNMYGISKQRRVLCSEECAI